MQNKNGPTTRRPASTEDLTYAIDFEALVNFEELDPIRFKPRGAGGLRNPVLESRPGPEATVIFFAFQLGGRLFEIGHLYDVS
jgi:hypothetical protein